MSSQLQELEMDRNVFHNVFTKWRKVFRFCVLTETFLAYPIKSIIRASEQLCSGSDVGILPGGNVFSSEENLFGLQMWPSFAK